MSVTNKVQGEGSRSRLFFTSTGFRIFEIRPSLQVVTINFEAMIKFFLGFLKKFRIGTSIENVLDRVS